MKISLAQAVNLLSVMTKRSQDLEGEMNRVTTETIEKGEQAPIPTRNLDVITDEIDTVETDILKLKDAIRKTNAATLIEWDGRSVSLDVALDVARTIRARAVRKNALGTRKKIERNSGSRFGGSAETTFTVALYDPEQYKAAAQKLEREANKLSMLIEQTNHKTEFEFAAEKYIEV